MVGTEAAVATKAMEVSKVANKATAVKSGGGCGGRGQTTIDPHYQVKSQEFEKYCWTHDCDCSHNGFKCEQQAMGHNPYAVKDNSMGGNPKNSQQKYLPSTIGKPDNWRVMEAQQEKMTKQQQYGGMAQQQQNNGFGAAQNVSYNSGKGNFGNSNFGNQQGFVNNFDSQGRKIGIAK